MNKVLEYMVFGKPQVMFDLREGRASAGGAAVYVARNCAADFGDALVALLDDPDARERMGREGAERVRAQLGWERSVRQLLLAYETALQGAGRASVKCPEVARTEPGAGERYDPS